MEKEQRITLRNAVVNVRKLLEKEFKEQLEGTYNILPDGRIVEDAPGDPITRARLQDVIHHYRAGGATATEAVRAHGARGSFHSVEPLRSPQDG